ncbi:MAG: hypothetical protein WDO06_03525 [Actinomycetota bacterium]
MSGFISQGFARVQKSTSLKIGAGFLLGASVIGGVATAVSPATFINVGVRR